VGQTHPEQPTGPAATHEAAASEDRPAGSPGTVTPGKPAGTTGINPRGRHLTGSRGPLSIDPGHDEPGSKDVTEAPALDPRRLRAGPLSRYLLVVAVLAVAGAIFTATREPDQVPVLVATRDIPAYHVISPADVALGTRPAAPKERYAALPVEGRLTLTAIAKNQPLRQAQVAPDVASVLTGALTVHGFAVSRATALNGALRPGDRIQLLMVRDGQRLALVRKDGKDLDRLEAVVLSLTDEREMVTLVVALRADDAQANQIAIGTGAAVIFKDPAAPRAPD
jgi:hypothetical protein